MPLSRRLLGRIDYNKQMALPFLSPSKKGHCRRCIQLQRSLCGTVARWLRLACLTMETKIALTRRAAAELALIGLIR